MKVVGQPPKRKDCTIGSPEVKMKCFTMLHGERAMEAAKVEEKHCSSLGIGYWSWSISYILFLLILIWSFYIDFFNRSWEITFSLKILIFFIDLDIDFKYWFGRCFFGHFCRMIYMHVLDFGLRSTFDFCSSFDQRERLVIFVLSVQLWQKVAQQQ